MPTFGPGTFTVGPTATVIDASDLVNNLVIDAPVNAAEPTTKLSGLVKPGARTYSWEISGNLDIDPQNATGLFVYSQENYGTEVDFVFTPLDGGMGASGKCLIDPLSFGSTEGYGAQLTSDFTWACVGQPVFAVAPPLGDDEPQEDAQERRNVRRNVTVTE